MGQADFSTPRSFRIGVIVTVLLIHVAVILGLIRAFAPGFTASVVRNVSEALTVIVTTREPTPASEPAGSEAAPQPAGAEGAAGEKAKPREVAAPEPKIVVAEKPAPKAVSTGTENRSGASEGEGTGAGAQGAGTGAGGSGTGQGGGGTRAEKIAGDISSSKDYPKASRDLRIGDHVIVVLTVGADGRVKGCRIQRPSRDPEADRITCELATKRFRFRPATDASGRPVESLYGWKQRWFYSERS